MAYRFVLEVPEPVAQEVNTAIGTVPDAQVLVMRNSHGLGFDDPYMDLSVATHSLAVVERIYQWMVDYGEPWPDVRMVLHDGRRVSLPKANVSLIAAAIRRDQPWVEHTMPQIGVHEPLPWQRGAVLEAEPEVPTLDLGDPGSLMRRLETAPRVPVHNAAPAEQFYEEVLDLHVAARAYRREGGTLRVAGSDYDPNLARLRGEEIDVVFLENGPLQLNLERSLRGVPLPYGSEPVEIHATATTEQIAAIRGRLLMFNVDLMDSEPGALRFADPFNVIWTFTPALAIGEPAPAQLQQG